MSETTSSGTGIPQGLSEQLSEITRQLASIASRMEKVETKLAVGSAEAKPVSEPAPALPTSSAPATVPAQPSRPPRHAEPVSPPVPPVAPLTPEAPVAPITARPEAVLPRIPEPAKTPPPLSLPPAVPVGSSVAPEPPVPIAAPIPLAAKPAAARPTPSPMPVASAIAASSSPLPQVASVPSAPKVQSPPPPPIPSPPGESRQDASSSDRQGAGFGSEWENLIGGKWALWAGTASLFLAAAFFLAYSWNFLPPFARLGVGFASGAAFLGAGSFFRQRALRWFSEGLTGAGLALFYLTIWTGTHRYGLLPGNFAFGAMMVTTAIAVYLAVLYDAISLNVLAVLGGFATPLLVSGGTGHSAHGASQDVPLFIYMAVLDSGILAVSLFKRWRGVTWLSFIATLVLFCGSIGPYGKAYEPYLFVFLTIYTLQFVGASCFYSLKHRETTAIPDLMLLFAATAFYGFAGYFLSTDLVSGLPGTFPLGVSLFFGVLVFATKAQAPDNKALRYSTGSLALFFLTIALPIQLKQDWWGIGWTAEGGMLLLLAWWLRSPLLRRGGQIVWLLALIPVLNSLTKTGAVTPHILFFNDRALTLLVGVVASALVALITRERLSSPRDSDSQSEAKALPPDGLAMLYAAYAVFGGAWLLTQEIYLAFSWNLYPSPQSWKAGALFVIACVISIYAFLVFVIGLKARHGLIRLCAVSLSALATALPVWASLAMPENQWTPFFNLRWLAYAVVAAGLFGTMWLVSRERELLPESEREAFGVMPSVSSLFVLVGLTLEVWAGFAHNASANATWQYPALFAVALIWSGYATMLLFLGAQWQQASLRAVGYLTGACSVILLLGHAGGATAIAGPSVMQIDPFFNWRFVAFALVSLLLLFQSTLTGKAIGDTVHEAYEEGVPCQLSIIASAVLLWGLTQETLESCHHHYLQLGGHWQSISYFLVTIVWSLCATVLFLYGLKRRSEAHLGTACIIGSVGIMFLLASDISNTCLGWNPVVNIRFAAFAIAVLAMLSLSWVLEGDDNIAAENGETTPVYMIGLLAPLGWLAATLALWGLTRELYEACFAYRLTLGTGWERTAFYAISVLWHMAAGWLLVIGSKDRRDGLATLGTIIALLASFGVAVISVDAYRLDWTPIINARFLSFVAGTAALGIANWQQSRRNGNTDSISLVGLLAAGLLLWGLTQEAYETCYYLRGSLGPTWERWAQMSISLVWSVYGALLLMAGINRRSRTGRIAALILLAATVGKVVLFDLSFLDTGLRILSLGGLGLALIFISWLYSRYGTERDEAEGQFAEGAARH